MEDMACGRPAIAANNSGHRDILTPDNAMLPNQMHDMVVEVEGKGVVARWSEPDLEEVTERLEWAYHHRRELEMIGERGARDVSQQTWGRTAERFGAILGVPGAFGSTSAPSA